MPKPTHAASVEKIEQALDRLEADNAKDMAAKDELRGRMLVRAKQMSALAGEREALLAVARMSPDARAAVANVVETVGIDSDESVNGGS